MQRQVLRTAAKRVFQCVRSRGTKGMEYLCESLRSREGKAAEYRNGDWLTRNSRTQEGKISELPSYKVTSQKLMCQNIDYAHLTLRKNLYIQKLEREGNYTWEHMLVIQNPYNKAPLTALLIFSTKEPYKVRYRVVGQCRECDFRGESSLCRQHRVAVFGLYAGRRNRIEVELVTAKGDVCQEKTLWIRTAPLPESLRGLVSVQKKSDRSAVPFLMITGGHEIHTCAFDEKGQIRFYLSKRGKAYGVYPMSGGRFIYTEKYVCIPSYFIPQGAQYYDMDYLGGVQRTYFTPNGLHHCAQEMRPKGNFIMASSSFGGTVENAVVEVNRNTGKMEKMLVIDTLFDNSYRDVKDWCHINAIHYDEKENCVILSLRNIHAVIKVDWGTFRLRWILSNPALWKNTAMYPYVLRPRGEIKWFYQQHAAYVAEVIEEGILRMVVYDNHWDRRRPVACFDGDEAHSWVSVFDIDETKREVFMVRCVPLPKSTIRSNAILQERNNRLFHMSGNLLRPVEGNQGLIEELNYETEECINSYLVKPGFFSAYPFAPQADVLEKNWAKLCDPKAVYMLGETIPVRRAASDCAQWEMAENFTDYSRFYFNENILYIQGEDHEFKTIYFWSRRGVYAVAITERIREKEKLADSEYAIPIQLKALQEGEYTIYFETAGGLFRIANAFFLAEKSGAETVEEP